MRLDRLLASVITPGLMLLGASPGAARALDGSTDPVWTANGFAIAPADSAQLKPHIVPDGAGGAVIVWEDKRGGPFLAYAQRLRSDGSLAPSWPTAGVLLPNRGISQGNLTVIADGLGGAFVASDDHGFQGATMLHHLGHDASPGSGWPAGVVSLAASYGSSGGSPGNFLPALAADDSGGVYAAWIYRDRLFQTNTVTRRTASAGIPPGWQLGGTYAGSVRTGDWDYPTLLCPDAGGGVLAAFQNNTIPSRITIGRFHADGTSEFAGARIASSPFDQTAPGLVSDGTGGAIVVWEDHRNDAFDQLFAQHISSDGSVAPGWTETGMAICTSPTAPGISSDFNFPAPLTSMVSDGAGGAYVAWTDYRDSAGTGQGDIYAQRLSNDGTLPAGWPPNGLAVCRVFGDQALPTLAADGAGGVLIAWQDRRGGAGPDIYATRIGPSGIRSSGWPLDGLAVCTAPGAQAAPVIISDGSEGAIIAWVDRRSGMPNIYAARVTSDGVVPVQVALVSSEALSDRARLTWSVAGGAVIPVNVYRRTGGSDWTAVARLSLDGDERIRYEDRDIVAGGRYDYRLGIVRDGREEFSGVTTIEFPIAPKLKLEGVRPNPATREFRVAFTLRDDSPARLEVLDVAGRSIIAREVGALGPGRHVVDLTEGRRFAIGVYHLRLTQAGRRLTARAVVTR